MCQNLQKKKLCLIYNTAPRYREAIFKAIDQEFDCDWYFGPTKTDIKEMDTSLLKNVKKNIRLFFVFPQHGHCRIGCFFG